ncbi:MAG: GTPase [Candidatus Woesearchaeota archaeon]
MSFQNIPPVETSDKFLDFAFSKANKTADMMRETVKDVPKYKSKKIEMAKIETVEEVLTKHFDRITTSFPNFENLTEFYETLLKTYLDIKELKTALGSVAWASTKVKQFSREYLKRMSGAQSSFDMNKLRRSYYGRISSVLKQIKKFLVFLENTRRILKTFPTIKTDIFTVAISGFPNVGKSTLLSKLTPAKPEIDTYAFTTKTLNLGYAKYDLFKIQYIDTPGTLDRKDKQNEIEMQANLAIKYVANMICYVFDLTETSATLKDQLKLLKKLKDFDKPIICYLSKTDLIAKDILENFEKEFENKKIPLCTSQKELEKTIISFVKKQM